jgi:hypothetical protein
MISSTLTSKVRFTFRDITDGSEYCLDLLQEKDGERAVALRTADAERHGSTVRTTIALSASCLRGFLDNPGTTPEVVTTEGEQFMIDAHRSWMLLEEAQFWLRCRKEKLNDISKGPWVNGMIPKQYQT